MVAYARSSGDGRHTFGLYDVGFRFPETCSFILRERESLRGPLGLDVGRDAHLIGKKPLSEYAAAARPGGRTITD